MTSHITEAISKVADATDVALQVPQLLDITQNEVILRHPANAARILRRRSKNVTGIHPIVRWAGGKRWLAGAANVFTPPKWTGRYFEPFLGGGAFFFAIAPTMASISDTNLELITTYKAVRDNPSAVIELLSTYPHNSDFYYNLRAQSPKRPSAIAARFIYLNRTCWNGLYRVNRQGQFNTPFGRHKNPMICDREGILSASSLLRQAKILSCDFEEALENVQPGDFVYLDPPYITGHQDNGFAEYNKHLFSWADQERLANLAIHLAHRGVYVLVSNANHAAVVRLYRGFHYHMVERRSDISGTVSSRGLTSEALLSNYPLLSKA